jgi:hypothetical protein
MKKNLHLLLLVSITFFYSQKSFSQTSVVQAQASFIYNFTRYIEWPAANKSGDFVIGVFASSPMYNELQSFTTNKKVGSQNIVVKKIKSVDEVNGVHILFVPFEKTKELSSIEGKIGESKTIIITEKTGAIEQGATINFILSEDNKLKYETKTSNATKIGLKCNSVLETMAYAKH